jgi:hypothetical protein
VTAFTADGRLFYRETTAGSGFESQSSPIVQIGLGAHSVVDDLEVVWTDQTVQHFHDVAVNKRYHLREGDDLVPLNVPSKEAAK